MCNRQFIHKVCVMLAQKHMHDCHFYNLYVYCYSQAGGMARVLGARLDGLEARAEAEAGRGVRVAVSEEIARLQEVGR